MVGRRQSGRGGQVENLTITKWKTKDIVYIYGLKISTMNHARRMLQRRIPKRTLKRISRAVGIL